MRLISIIVTALAAVSVVANPLPSGKIFDATPAIKKVADGSLRSLSKRNDTVPTAEELKKRMHTKSEMKDKSLFYSGPGGYRDKALALGKKIGRHILTDFFLDPNYPTKWADNNTEFWNHASQAMAELTSGTAFVLLPSNETGLMWYRGTFWDRIEWPTLVRNPAVKEVIRVNPDNDHHEKIYP